MKQKIDEKWLRGLDPSSLIPEGRDRAILWDKGQKGLGLVLHRSGTMSWILRYSLNGRPGKTTLGQWPDLTYDAAKKKAQKLRGGIADGLSPERTKAGAMTLRALVVERLRVDEYPSLAPSTVRTYDMLWDRHILPKMGKLLIDEVALKDVAALHHAMRGNPRSANQALAVLARCLHLAERWGFRPPNSNPCSAIDRYPEVKRDRYLTTEELVELGKRMKAEEKKANPYAIAALRFAMLTGMRRGEVCALRWDQVEPGKLILKEHKTAKKVGTKTIHLAEPAMNILESLEKMLGCPYVFAGEHGGMAEASLRSLWDRLRHETSFEDVRVHDLRHTFASIGLMEGLTLEQIGGLLGHRAAATTKRYAHLMQEAAIAAASKTAGAVANRLG